jgi:acetyl-CoA synthetase
VPAIGDALKAAVAVGLGAPFRPKAVVCVADLPKTRSLKIMRRVMRAVWVGEEVGDLSGLVNPTSVAGLRAAVEGRDPI